MGKLVDEHVESELQSRTERLRQVEDTLLHLYQSTDCLSKSLKCMLDASKNMNKAIEETQAQVAANTKKLGAMAAVLRAALDNDRRMH